MQVRDLVDPNFIKLRAHDSLAELVRVLGETPQDIFPVVDPQGKLVGTVSELDLLRVIGPLQRTFGFGPRKLVREGVAQDIEDVMTPRPSTTRLDDGVDTALRKMESLRLPQLIVLDEDGGLAGLLRARDIFRALYPRGGPKDGQAATAEDPER